MKKGLFSTRIKVKVIDSGRLIDKFEAENFERLDNHWKKLKKKYD